MMNRIIDTVLMIKPALAGGRSSVRRSIKSRKRMMKRAAILREAGPLWLHLLLRRKKTAPNIGTVKVGGKIQSA